LLAQFDIALPEVLGPQEQGEVDGDGQRTGLWKFRDNGGVVISRGTYVDGFKHGMWEDFSGDGVRTFATEYKDGLPHGTCEAFCMTTGVQGERASFDRGLLHGAATAWWDTGDVLYEGTYSDGDGVGTATLYMPDENLQLHAEQVDGNIESLAQRFDGSHPLYRLLTVQERCWKEAAHARMSTEAIRMYESCMRGAASEGAELDEAHYACTLLAMDFDQRHPGGLDHSEAA
jgi:hypothetical protein